MRNLLIFLGLLVTSHAAAAPVLRTHQEWATLCEARGVALAACLHRIMRVGSGDNFVAAAAAHDQVITRSGVSLAPGVRKVIHQTNEDSARETVLTLISNQRCRMNGMPQSTANDEDLVQTYLRLTLDLEVKPRLLRQKPGARWRGLEFHTPGLAGRLLTDSKNNAQVWVACEGAGAEVAVARLAHHILGSARQYRF